MSQVSQDLFDTLLSTNWSGRFESFDVADLRRLRAYDRLASELGQESFFAKPQSFTVKSGSPARFEHAGRQALRSMTMVFRQLWQDGELAQFEKVRGLLRQRTKQTPDGADARRLIDEVGTRFANARREVLMKHVWEDDPVGKPIREFRAARVLDDWFNGVLFHPDERKTRAVAAWSPIAYEFSAVKAINHISGVMWELHPIVTGALGTRLPAPRSS